MHHTYPVVPIPLDQLKAAGTNQFRLRVSDEHPWNWPQNLIYGVHARAYYAHRVSVPDPGILRPGENTIRTGKTPLYDGKMVHGMEVNWPGIMVLIQLRL